MVSGYKGGLTTAGQLPLGPFMEESGIPRLRKCLENLYHKMLAFMHQASSPTEMCALTRQGA